MESVSIEQFCDEGFELSRFKNLIHQVFDVELKSGDKFESLSNAGYEKI